MPTPGRPNAEIARILIRKGTETILLVEDESSIRAFTKITLQRFGYRVAEADSAETAMTLLQRFEAPIHLLLTNVVLP